ncbi:transcriptional regulator [Streptomyces antioxidans]|uniref:Transcriptional regulator n=1 Tax=Streptomyces antioxidans TaxID=1507734 RepID=A0A1V4CYN2_9ACTN|nr:Scr1 family TA system antitoxin-like transcriptional regulator [Streptomyces antioxidans]OPF74053.1 transcriptional regulator [Streptomyces antioxidans]
MSATPGTTPDRGPAPLVLGAYLRSLRLAKGLTLSEAAQTIHRSAAELSRMELGQGAESQRDMDTLARFYGVTDFATTVGSPRGAEREPGTVRDDDDGWVDRLRACEHHASAICVYASVIVPRIVQTMGCPVDHLTLLTTATRPPRIPAHTVLPDQTRQDVTVLLDGAMLLRTFANPAAMAAQMAYLQRLQESPQGPRILVVPFQAGVLPPPGTLYRFHLHGQELFAEETWGALYTTGADSQAARGSMDTGLAAAKDPEASAAMLDIARRRYELLAKDPESDPLLEELTA